MAALIGEGGMGQVYRATDTNLGRQVAIKVLPDALAGSPERIARFEREARTLAQLNHPNVAAIYGVE
ncbi:MAG TPA: protein kinase, partial [Polyangiaceae bacterium]|nr:protein kinase [Polyangiaceae bacterium]